MFVDSQSELWSAVSRVADDEGLSLYDLERTPFGLRVFVERLGLREDVTGAEASPEGLSCSKQAGVDSEDCARLFRRLLTLFRVEGASLGVADEPSLEVSSPGINRHLRLVRHFHEAVGARIKIQFRSDRKLDLALDSEQDSKKTICAILEKVGEKALILSCPDSQVNSDCSLEVEMASILKARVDFAFSGPEVNSVSQKRSNQKRAKKNSKIRH